jgi:transposase-like protein
MTDFKAIYVVYMNNNVILGTSTVEEQAYELIRTEATIHQESEFRIQKTETVFDWIRNPRDKLSLQMIRN